MAAVWDCFAAAGATHLVLSGAADTPQQVRQIGGLLRASRVTVVRLRASRDAITGRVLARGRGVGPQLAGDELVGQPPEVLAAAADEAWQQQARLDEATAADVELDTTGMAPADTAARVVALL